MSKHVGTGARLPGRAVSQSINRPISLYFVSYGSSAVLSRRIATMPQKKQFQSVTTQRTLWSVAYSGKQKKAQLKAKKQRKREEREQEDTKPESPEDINCLEEVLAVNEQPRGRRNRRRYDMKFRKETPVEEQRKALHVHTPIVHLSMKGLEQETENFYPSGLDYPARPEWTSDMSKQELERSEKYHFRLFSEKLDEDFSGKDLSLYELNLETWRQLWRVTEKSDILLIIVDARYSVTQFPPYLYHHLVEKENKGIILILNKSDLVPASVIVAWEGYFHNKFPRLLVVPFSSVEGYGQGRGLLKLATEGSLRLVDACQKLVDDAVDLTHWRRKIEEERDTKTEEHQKCEAAESVTVVNANTRPECHGPFKDGLLTIGTIGHPNVGKSSLINALMGKKVVSVSKTPGHTKHFQTICLTKNVQLCDCPGLVFPSTVPMQLQVLMGSFPIDQVRDPIAVLSYVTSRLDIPAILKLKHPDADEKAEVAPEWTAFYVSEAWAKKRGYNTYRKGTPDVSRAANELLRFCVNGYKSLVFYLIPPGYSKDFITNRTLVVPV